MACARALAGFSVVQESEGKDETPGSRAGAVEEAQGQNTDQVGGSQGYSQEPGIRAPFGHQTLCRCWSQDGHLVRSDVAASPRGCDLQRICHRKTCLCHLDHIAMFNSLILNSNRFLLPLLHLQTSPPPTS